MSRADDRQDPAQTEAADAAAPGPGSAPARGGAVSVSLADLPVAGLTRRRVALILGALVAAWVILLFAHQIGQASEASAKADAMRATNATLATQVTALQQELELIQRQAFIDQQARGYRLGTSREIPFTLADGAPTLAPDAPGSAGVRLGAVAERPNPLASWIRLLFGPGGDPSTPTGGRGS
jgi:cell division protein FtsB